MTFCVTSKIIDQLFSTQGTWLLWCSITEGTWHSFWCSTEPTLSDVWLLSDAYGSLAGMLSFFLDTQYDDGSN